MSTSAAPPGTHAGAPAAARRPWVPPDITDLPPLEQLTLQSGSGDIEALCTPLSGCGFSFLPSPDRTTRV